MISDTMVNSWLFNLKGFESPHGRWLLFLREIRKIPISKFPDQWITLSRPAGHGLTIQNTLSQFLKIMTLINENLSLPSSAFSLAERPFRLKSQSKAPVLIAGGSSSPKAMEIDLRNVCEFSKSVFKKFSASRVNDPLAPYFLYWTKCSKNFKRK